MHAQTAIVVVVQNPRIIVDVSTAFLGNLLNGHAQWLMRGLVLLQMFDGTVRDHHALFAVHETLQRDFACLADGGHEDGAR